MRKAALLAITGMLLTVCQQPCAKTTIRWWQFWTDPDIRPTVEAIVEDFEQTYPDIQIELTDLTWSNGHEKIVIAFASGTAPDVVELGSDWIAQFAANDQLADLSGSIKEDSSRFRGWGMATYEDRVFAYPWILGTRVLFANRELLARAGYEQDFVPYAWPDLKEAAFKINALGDEIYGWGSNTPEKHRLYKKYLPFFWSAGASIFSDDNKYCLISSMQAIDALRLYKELHDSCGYVADQRGIEDAFLNGEIGFIISGDWLLKRIQMENRRINLVSTLIPGPEFPGKSFLGGEFLAVNAASEHQDAAMKLIRFVTSPENQVRFCKAARAANPSSIEAQQDEYFTSNPHLQTFAKQILSAKHPPVDPDWVFIEEAIEEAVEDALFGSGLVAEPLWRASLKVRELKGL